MNAERKTCRECGTELAEDAVRGLCPLCLLQVGLASQTTDPNATVAANGGGGKRRPLPNVGEQFGSYRILRLLGRGGMGVVYEAEEQDTGRRIALKVLARQFDSAKDRTRFLREGRLAASINHPNSVYVFGTEEIDGVPTIAMELVSGGTLAERLKHRGPMRVPEAVDAILQIIAGLEAAQAIGILHRDIKPGNCFEDADGTIKIGDFGLSISTAAREENNLTADGAMVGTPAFCSPEQLRGEELSTRSDMYSVGGTLFFLLTGRVPFEGHNVVQLTANVLEKPAPSPRDFRKEIPKGLASVVLRCLEKQSADRFKSYDDLRQSLAPYSSTAPTPATLSLRFLAGLLDGTAVGLVGMVIMFLFFGNPMGWLKVVCEESPRKFLWMLGWLLPVLLYYGILEGIWGAAAGKALCGLRVVKPNKTSPGFFSAALRALVFVVLPSLPSWIAYSVNPKAVIGGPFWLQQLPGFLFYVVLALLFCTARRRNGFAAVQDLMTKTRVISRAALERRPLPSIVETQPTAVDAKPAIGPYQVLETLEATAEGQWLLCYDLRLLRKVWIRTVPPGTPPIPTPLRNIGRVTRLRWLMGRRSPEENWDAFEAASGKSLLQLIQDCRPRGIPRNSSISADVETMAVPQPWRQVRFWLYDLAKEISAAKKDGTLPEVLALDRVWITRDGRAKLLDFPSPGLANPNNRQADTTPSVVTVREGQSPQRFLSEVAVAALEGRADAAVAEPAVLLPLHARNFLKSLPQLADADAVVAAFQPLLRRVTTVSRLRRAAIVAGCAAFPVLMSVFSVVATNMMHEMAPNAMELFHVLQQRSSVPSDKENADVAVAAKHKEKTLTNRHIAVYIASHFRDTITDKGNWESPFMLSLVKGDDRAFAERSVAEHPAPTRKEIAEADAVLEPRLRKYRDFEPQPIFILMMLLTIYVSIPAVVAALLFRGGLVVWMAGVTFLRRDGKRASRLRVFWRALVAWGPLWLALILIVSSSGKQNPITSNDLPLAVLLTLFFVLSIVSVALPTRGLADRLAGTWPMPR